MLQLKNVKKAYGTELILDIPSLHLGNNIHWVKGANGSGKTTFLKMIAGLIPFEGDIILDSSSLKIQPVLYRKRISWAEAEPIYPGFLKGGDLLALYRSIRKASAKQTEETIQTFGLNSFIDSTIETYSAGMIKKLSLALAFIGNPSLIILDEPLITLDHDSFTSIYQLILTMHKKDGTCFLLSSHQELNLHTRFPCEEITIRNHTALVNEGCL